MPSWPIHIALANKLRDKYNLTDDFILGNIMPDATNGFIIKDISHVVAHSLTHYNFEGPGRPPQNNIQKFLDTYQTKLDNPIIYGSYIHLLTDNFYNEYFYQTHRIDKKTAILNDGTKSDEIEPWKLKQAEFGKFGDYLIYRHQLGDKINYTDKTLEYISSLTYLVNKQDLDLIVNKVNSLINKDIKVVPKYKMFSQIELENLFDDCYNYLEKIMEGKEDIMLEPKYNHEQVEQGKYENWKQKGYFQAGDLSKKPFCVVIPPPNVTGKLHLGHAWDTTLQDIMIRYKRMDGYDALWVPGMDHAGIATQAKVDKKLKEQGIKPREMDREEWLKVAWDWKREYAENIHEQWAKLGLSLDYTKERFTLDEGLSKAVRKVFVDLYNESLIYRGERIINWDPVQMTALSNEEVIYKEDEGAFYHLKYYLEDKSMYLDVATTRPETLFGDTAVAVNPKDERYKDLIGKNVILPIVNKIIPIVGDEHADPEFGTGVVKITPAHDPNDFEVGNRHNLERVIVMNPDATMNENAGKYRGMTREACREALLEDLQKEDLLLRVEPMVHSVGHSERSNTVVEPYLSKQWFVKMRPLADRVLENQKNKNTKVHFVPERYEKTMNHWMEITYDWCISRQLWWGHRIPAWYKGDEVYVGMEAPSEEGWVQDSDVLDTWFSSALWPFSTLGWPEVTDDFKRYYPNNCLVTGYDIIPFWVNRMTFQGLHFTDSRPFENCLIHGLIRDKEGRKMSKSLGNGVDPMDVIKEYGTDALRFFLTTNSAPGMDLRYDEEKVKSTWNFINKLWNASRYVLMNIGDFKKEEYTLENLSLADKWILNKLNKQIISVRESMDKFDYHTVGNELYSFTWEDFCDWYIELSKTNLNNTTKSVLLTVLMDILKMLHPFMPYVTEEIYSKLPIKDSESIMISEYPKENKEWNFEIEAKHLESITELITKIRKWKLENNISSYLFVTACPLLLENKEIFEKLLKVEVLQDYIGEYTHYDILFVDDKVSLYYDGRLSEEERERLEKEKTRLIASIERREKLLTNVGYVEHAPANIVEKERQDLSKEKQELVTLTEKLNS